MHKGLAYYYIASDTKSACIGLTTGLIPHAIAAAREGSCHRPMLQFNDIHSHFYLNSFIAIPGMHNDDEPHVLYTANLDIDDLTVAALALPIKSTKTS